MKHHADERATLQASGLASVTYGSLTVNNVSMTLSALTDVDGSSVYVQNGGSLALPGLTSYAAYESTFQVDGTGSVLDVSALSTVTIQPNGAFWALYATNGGEVKLTALASLTGSFFIVDEGRILDNNLTSLKGVDVTLDGTDDPQVANSWTSFTGGELRVTGASTAYLALAISTAPRCSWRAAAAWLCRG